MKHLLTLILVLLVPGTLSAQHLRSRLVCAEDSLAASYASVVLTDIDGPSIVAKATTDARGYFELQASHYGKEKAILVVSPSSLAFKVRRDTVELHSFPQRIVLQERETLLGEAQVVSRVFKPTPTGYTYDMHQFREQFSGREAQEVLSLLPGMQLEDNKLTVNGREVKEIYINGEKVIDPEELKSIKAEMLQTAEVDYWEAGELGKKTSAATLRIRVKLPSQGGYSLVLNQNVSPLLEGKELTVRSYDRLMAKSPDGKWNFKAMVNANYSDKRSKTDQFDNYDKTGTAEGSRSAMHAKNNVFCHTELSTVYEFAPQSIVGVRGGYVYSSYPRSFTYNYTPSRKLDLVNYDKYKNPQYFVTAYLNAMWGQKHNQLEWSADYFYNHNRIDYSAHSFNAERVDTGYTAFGYKSPLEVANTTLRLRLPFSSSSLLRLGYSIDWMAQSDLPLWQEEGEHPSLGEQVKRKRNTTLTHYASANFMGVWKRIYYSIGANFRSHDSRNRALSDTVHIRQSAFNPRASFKFMLDKTEQNSFEIAYYRDLGDVDLNNWSETRQWSDATHYWVGDKNLKTSEEHNLRLQLVHLHGRLSATVEFQKVENAVLFDTFEDPDLPGVIGTKPRNVSGDFTMSFRTDYRWNVAKWWVMRPSVYGILRNEGLTVNGIRFHGWQSQFGVSLYNQFAFDAKNRLVAQIRYEPAYDMYCMRMGHYEYASAEYTHFFSETFTAGASVTLYNRRWQFNRLPTQTLASRTYMPHTHFNINVSLFLQSKRQVEVKEIPQTISIPQ